MPNLTILPEPAVEVGCDPSGRPTIAGTTISIAELLRQLGGGVTVDGFAEDYELRSSEVRAALCEIAPIFDVPLTRWPARLS